MVSIQAAEADRDLRILKSQLLVAQAKQQALILQIKYAQVNAPISLLTDLG